MLFINKKTVKYLFTTATALVFPSVLLLTTLTTPAEAGRNYYRTILTRNFKGVRSCNHTSRQRREARLAVNNYLKARSYPAYSNGWTIVKTWYNNKKSRWGKRSCKGQVRVRLRFYDVTP